MKLHNIQYRYTAVRTQVVGTRVYTLESRVCSTLIYTHVLLTLTLSVYHTHTNVCTLNILTFQRAKVNAPIKSFAVNLATSSISLTLRNPL